MEKLEDIATSHAGGRVGLLAQISVEGVESLEQLEDRVAAATGATARALMIAALEEIEDRLVADLRTRGRLQVVKWRSVDVLTRFGWMRIRRRQYFSLGTKSYVAPLDRVLRLRGHLSPWVQRQVHELGAHLTVRDAAHVLSGYLETPVDHRSFWTWLAKTRPVTEGQAEPIEGQAEPIES